MQVLPYDDPGAPDLRSPVRYLEWVGRGQWATLVVAIGFGVVWMVGQALFPAAISRAVDQGIVARDGAALTRWSLALLGLGVTSALAGVMRHRLAVTNWMRAAFRTTQLIGWHAADTGEALPRERPTGDVVAVVASDAMRVGGVFDVLARFAGAIVSFVVVAVLLLTSSTPLGLLVLLGVPTLLGLLGFVVRPLQRRQAAQREESGRLIGLGADTVAGLRVLRGIGGEETYLRRYDAQSQAVRVSGYHVAGMQAALDAAQVLLPGLFVLLVTWLGARFAVEGEISVGQLVAFYGYSAFLVIPLRTATEFLDRYSRARIGAAKTIDVLRVRADQVDRLDDGPASDQVDSFGFGTGWAAEPGPDARLHDERSGLVIDPGLLTVVVSARPEDSAALADRLGRFGTDTAGVRLDAVALTDLPVATVRRRVVVSETDPRLFTGTLRDELDPGGGHGDEALLAALAVASGDDVLEALPDGLDSEVEERGRSFSGGQRQRLTLARAILTGASTLVLVEPTSAVDAHTEARIAVRLADARRGRTTVVMSSSPLVLDHADQVVLLHEGRVAATGRHRDLMRTHPGYRAVVVRGEGDPT